MTKEYYRVTLETDVPYDFYELLGIVRNALSKVPISVREVKFVEVKRE